MALKDPRWIRAEIIRTLYVAHPEWTPRALLIRVLEDRGVLLTDEDFNSEMTYLRDWPDKLKGYVEFREREVGPKREKLYSFRLTPLGVNLVEGIAPRDTAIAIPE